MSQDIITQWAMDARTRGVTEKTIYDYTTNLHYYESLLPEKSIAIASKMDIRAYVDWQRKKGLTTATIRNRLIALSSLYEFLIFEGLRADNPVREIRVRYLKQYKSSNEVHTHKLISVEEAARVVSACTDIRDMAMLLLLFKTGVRRGELFSMEVQDINWQHHSITLKPKEKGVNVSYFSMRRRRASCVAGWKSEILGPRSARHFGSPHGELR